MRSTSSELNEAFAAQVIRCCQSVGMDPRLMTESTRTAGDAIGHPFGMTGLRIMSSAFPEGLDDAEARIGIKGHLSSGGQGHGRSERLP